MMKKWMLLALALCLMLSATAVAETANMNDVLQQLVNAASQSVNTSVSAETAQSTGVDVGPEVRIDDSFYQKVRASAYLYEGKYNKEVNVLIEVKNVSGKTLYADDATITAYNAAGEVLDQEEYASVAPSMIENGGSLFIWDYFYDPDFALSDISYFTVTVESETDSYRQYAAIDATAAVANGIVSTQIANTQSAPIYGLEATVVICDDAGAILDVTKTSTGNAIGVAPGSTMILRDNASDHANDGYLASGNCTAYGLYEVE